MTNEETKDEILNAADALFNKSGIRATTIDDVCRAVGISKKTFYQFYLNKEDLVASVSKYHLDQKFAQFKEILDGTSQKRRDGRNWFVYVLPREWRTDHYNRSLVE